MQNKQFNSPWKADDWLDRASKWINTSLATRDIKMNGDIQQIHEYPWSTVFKIPTQEGDFFFKATTHNSAYEIVFSSLIQSIDAGAMPEILASYPEKGWMIMRDGGKRLREHIAIDLDWQHWQNVLKQYANLQIRASSEIDNLLDSGIPDRRLEKFPSLFESLIADRKLFQPDSDDALSDEDYQRLLNLVPVVKKKCNQLATYAIPETIHHGDLHDGNIFYDGSDYVFYDWGDASVSHPFFSLRTVYVSAEMRFGLEENAPELDRLRDYYLPVWRSFESEANLLQAFDLAKELWAISSLLSWHQGISRMNSDVYKNYQHILPALSEELFNSIKL